MDLTMEREDGVLTVRVEGRIDGSTVLSFQETVESAMEGGDRAVIVDCEALSYIGSAGLRTVLGLAKTVSNRNVRFALCCLSGQVLEIFEKSGFDTIIAIHPSREVALDSVDG